MGEKVEGTPVTSTNSRQIRFTQGLDKPDVLDTYRREEVEGPFVDPVREEVGCEVPRVHVRLRFKLGGS